MSPFSRSSRRALLTAALTCALVAPTLAVGTAASAASAVSSSTSYDDLPDPMERGSYEVETIQETKLGLVDLQEPNSSGQAPNAGTSQAPEKLEIRGALYRPANRTEPSPVIVLVHGNHGSCDSGQNTTTVSCTQFKRNEAGYAYLGENLASWGYTTFSVSQDQLMMRQDSSKGKGMHQRRKLIAATLDALAAANADGGLPVDEHTTIGTTLVGTLDMSRIGLMGHSRGGDAVTNFIDYNQTRTDGPRYPLRGVIALAPTDYERKAPTGTPFLAILPSCEGDVTNRQGARTFERSQYRDGDDPFPKLQQFVLGANHNWFNTVWFADGQDGGNVVDAACGDSRPTNANNVQPNNHRLSGAASYDPPSYVIDNSDTYNPLVNTKISGDPERMGDQEKIGLATMAAFFRRYVGGEGAFDPYMTGELSATDSHLQIPESACPTSETGRRIGCEERVSTNYFAPPSERVDVIRPEIVNPLTENALGGTLSGEGFVNPYLKNGGVPVPATTEGGYDWCNPEPDDFAPEQLGKGTLPTAEKPCPLPAKDALGGQNGTREKAPVNHSYGRQLALAWEQGRTATLTAQIPAKNRDVSGLKALSMSADVNFFDERNPGAKRTENGQVLPVAYDPASTTQDFVIALIDTKGKEATVHAGDERWGNALHMSAGTTTTRTHIVLDQIRVPLSEFAAQGVDITSLAKLELRFGVDGTPESGSIQLADVRFQEAVGAPKILSDGDVADGAGHGAVEEGPDPADYLDTIDNTLGKFVLKDQVAHEYNNTTWVVDDDRAECSDANFTSIQDAIDHAAPWDTIVVCAGTYDESSTPIAGPGNPVAAGAKNGLTITKPLKIKGAGADKVTIRPDQSIRSLAGQVPYLRDGGGNVITVSRQSLGSTDTNEMFVDISGVTVTSGSTYAEAGIAFFGAAGRVSESVVGPLHTAADADELAEAPHGWGIVQTGVVKGAGPGTVETDVIVADSVVKGYQSGGILFDGGSGKDGAPANTERRNLIQRGYVSGTIVQGSSSKRFAQTGVQYANGTEGAVTDSRIVGNYDGKVPSQSYGLLLTDAKLETANALTVSSNVFSGNGFSVYNATADGSTVRTDARVTVRSSYLGQSNPVAGGPADPADNVEAISGSNSVTVSSRASTPPASVPTTVGATVDEAPKASLVDPIAGSTVKVGETVSPLVRAIDDHAIRSVTLTVDGVTSDPATSAPYKFDWVPSAAQAGKTVTITAKVTDSAGQTTTTDAFTLKVADSKAEGPVTGPTKPSPVVPTPTAKIVKVVKKANGTAIVKVKVNGAGVVRLSGKKVVTTSVTAKKAGTIKIKVQPKKRLAKGKKAKVSVKIVFTSGGKGVSKSKKITLVRKKR